MMAQERKRGFNSVKVCVERKGVRQEGKKSWERETHVTGWGGGLRG